MYKPLVYLFSLGLITATLQGCSLSEDEAAMFAEDTGPVKISVTTVKQQSIEHEENLPARVQAFRVAEIRPQVGGILERVLFNQGSEVKAGQALFKINAELFQADVNSEKAALSKAESEAQRLYVQLQRYQQLLPSHAVSKQEVKNTEAEYQQALSQVAQTKASLARQQLHLRYATVQAPISGRIGKILVTEGSLVNSNDPTAMAVVQQIDKVYVDVKQSIAEYEALQDQLSRGELQKSAVSNVEILNSQGQPYAVTGKLLFSDTQVDPETGDVNIRILVDNPQRKLLPGMYVRVKMNRASQPNAIVVPEQAVQRNSNGQAQVLVLDAKQNTSERLITLGALQQGYYVVQQGLKVGERIVVQGHERIQPKVKLNIAEWKAPATPIVAQAQTPAAAGSGGS
ncbi:efflux RND transporter periplasmic adaptor subunit [Acinetobacter rudis]|uniref:efflux RND transporter periplasmic adaptor subunit n=1 Tax=Acinetobacter rudis TaxID=632955 RepID=UPI00280F4FC8|nr:efflux RND transporter periplasmic adaptor subunit [Acinetobacter rudis]MDQ8954593.1 efflux RND transporter periplasmic adaptor subunit [Acinetobacter rudis]